MVAWIVCYMETFELSPSSNKQILALNDYNKQNFLCVVLMSWRGLCECDNIKRMITLTVITLSGLYCILQPHKEPNEWHNIPWSYFRYNRTFGLKMQGNIKLVALSVVRLN